MLQLRLKATFALAFLATAMSVTWAGTSVLARFTASAPVADNAFSTSSCFGPVPVDMSTGGNLRFTPASLTIEAGCSVTWTNTSAAVHTTQSTSPWVGLWDSGNISTGSTYTRVFPTAGTFPYKCNYHVNSGMTGTITVNP